MWIRKEQDQRVLQSLLCPVCTGERRLKRLRDLEARGREKGPGWRAGQNWDYLAMGVKEASGQEMRLTLNTAL